MKPNTIPAKFLVMITAVWGAIMISLIVLTVSSVLDLKKNQLKALKQIRATRSAANTIVLSMRYFLAKKKYYKTRFIVNPSLRYNSAFVKLITVENSYADHSLLAELRSSDPKYDERSQLREMVLAKNLLAKQLEEFSINKQGIKDIRDQKDQEILMISRLVKAEVIDIAVMMDELTTVIDR